MNIYLQISTEKLLEKYFSEYKDYHKYAIIGMIILMVAYQIWQAIFVSRKIEKFKTDLKKSEIKFSRFHNMQIDALKIIYDKIVTLHYKNHRLFSSKSNGHSRLKTRIHEWKTEFETVIDTFHRERILLPPEFEETIKKFEKNFKDILTRLNEELENISELEAQHESTDEQVIYGAIEEEDLAINARMKALNENEAIKNSEKTLRELRGVIEKYFAELVK